MWCYGDLSLLDFRNPQNCSEIQRADLSLSRLEVPEWNQPEKAKPDVLKTASVLPLLCLLGLAFSEFQIFYELKERLTNGKKKISSLVGCQVV